MSVWLARLLGAERLEGGHAEIVSVHWARLGTPFLAFLFLLAAAAGLYAIVRCYRCEPDYCLPRRKRALAALRGAGFLLALLIFAGPVLEVTQSDPVRGRVVVLLDASRSMARRDPLASDEARRAAAELLGLLPAGAPAARPLAPEVLRRLAAARRLDFARALVEGPGSRWLEALRADYDVEIWSFARAEDLKPLSRRGQVDAAALRALQPDGVATEIGGALRAATERARGRPLAGIVLLTDGDNNRGEEPAAVAEELNAPLFPIGLGAPRARDVAVAHVFMESKLFLDDLAPVYVRLRQHGFDGAPAQLVVSLAGEECARQPVTLSRGGEQTETVHLRPAKPGHFTVRVEVVPPEGDAEPANNFKQRAVQVIDKKIKVLVLERAPRWEYRYLATALQRDRRVEAKFLLGVPDLAELAAPGTPFLRNFPGKTELFGYDVIVFGNLPNTAFWTERDLALLQRFVVLEGGGLWFIAGRNHFPDEYKDSKLEPLIPVEFDRQPEATAEETLRGPPREGFRAVLTPDGRGHGLTRLGTVAGSGSEEENAALWQLVPDLYWCHPARRPKLGATVLLARPAPSRTGRAASVPLLVTQQAGRGRVLYSATDEFWRMRFPVELGPSALERFYAHAIQYLGLPKCLGGSPRVELNLDADQYAVGDTARVTARVLSKDTFEPSAAARLAARAAPLAGGPELPFELFPTPGQPGMFGGQVAFRAPGRYRLALRDEGPEGEAAAREVAVTPPQWEQEAPELKAELLQQLARAATPGAGPAARLYGPAEAHLIPAALRAATGARPPVRVEDPVWDAPFLLILFVLVLGLEWTLRKRSDLI